MSQPTFAKKDILYSETMGVCRVSDIVKLSGKNKLEEPRPYYLLKNVADASKIAYIPVENHKVELRELISIEAAAAYSEEEVKQMDELHREEVNYVLARDVKVRGNQ